MDHPSARRYRKLKDCVERAVAAYGHAEILVYLRSAAYLSHDYDCLLNFVLLH